MPKRRAGVPAGLVYTAKEMIADPHYQARQMIEPVTVEDGRVFPMPYMRTTLAERSYSGARHPTDIVVFHQPRTSIA